MVRSVRALTALAGTLALAGAGSAAALAARNTTLPGAQAPAERASATLVNCHADPALSNRYATFGAQMEALPGTGAMAMQFQLQESTPLEPRFKDVSAPGLGTWQQSAHGIALFKLNQEVQSLPAPAQFRVVVRYRWLDSHHHTIHRARRQTPVCKMPDERPNLLPGTIVQTPDPQQQATDYNVIVRNSGLGDAEPFAVALAVGGTALPPVQVSGLDSQSSTDVTFVGPRCTPGTMLVVSVDPAGVVDESDKTDNSKTVVC